jgi:hypothetical protein
MHVGGMRKPCSCFIHKAIELLQFALHYAELSLPKHYEEIEEGHQVATRSHKRHSSGGHCLMYT